MTEIPQQFIDKLKTMGMPGIHAYWESYVQQMDAEFNEAMHGEGTNTPNGIVTVMRIPKRGNRRYFKVAVSRKDLVGR